MRQDSRRKSVPISRQKRFLKIALLFLAIAAALGGLAVYRLSASSRRLQRHVETLLKKYELESYSIGRVHGDGLTGIRISDITLGGEEPDAQPYMQLKGVRLAGDWPAFFGGKMEIRSIVVDQARIVLHRDETGRWKTGRGVDPAMLADTAPVRIRASELAIVFSDSAAPDDETTVKFGPIEFNTMRLSRRETRVVGALEHAALGNWTFDVVVPDGSRSINGEITGRRVFLGRDTRMLLPPPIRSYWEIGSISRGEADMWLGFELNINTGEISGVHANVRFSDCALSPRGAPYPLSGVSGQMQYDGRRLEFSGAGRVGTGDFRVGGFAVPSGDTAYIDATVSLSNYTLTDRMETAWMGATAEHVWLKTRPTGEVEGQIRLFGDVGRDKPPEILASLSLKDGRIWPSELPRPISNVSGSISLTPDALTIESAEGNYDGAAVSIERQSVPVKPGAPLSFSVNARNLSLSDELKRAISGDWIARLPHGLGDLWDGLRLTGKADVDFSLSRQADAEGTIASSAVIRLSEATLAHGDLPIRFTHISGKVEAGPEYASAEGLRARSGDMSFDVEQARLAFNPAGEASIRGGASNIRLDGPARDIVPTALLELSDRNAFRGALDIRANIDVDGDSIESELRAETTGGSIAFEKFPYPIVIRRASFLALNGKSVEIDLSGVIDDAAVTLAWSAETRETPYNLEFKADRLRLDEKLERALPEWGGEMWRRINPSGDISVDMKVASSTEGGEMKYTAAGEVGLLNVAANPSLIISDMAGKFAFRALLPPNPEMKAAFEELAIDYNIDRLWINREPLASLTGSAVFSQAVQRAVIERCEYFGGEISGEWARDRDTATTSFKIESRNIDVAAVNQARALGFNEIDGRLESGIEATTRSGMGGATGQGMIRISDGSVAELPGGPQLMEYFRHARPEGPLLTEVRYELKIDSGRIDMTSMNFTTPHALLIGACRPDPEDEGRIIVNFTPEYTTRTDEGVAIREVIQALISNRNIRVPVPASFDKPAWRLDPSPALSESIIRLLDPAGEGD